MHILEKLLHLNIVVVIIVVVGSIIKLIMMSRKELRENQKTQELQDTLDTEYGHKKLLNKLGRDDVQFPILVFGSTLSDISFVDTREAYIANHYRHGLLADYILDASGKRYIFTSLLGTDLDIQIPGLLEHTFQGVSPTGDIKTFEHIQTHVIATIQDLDSKGSSIYINHIPEIQKTTSVRELVYALQQVQQ